MLSESSYVSRMKDTEVVEELPGSITEWGTNAKKERTFRHCSRETTPNAAVTAEGRALSGMAKVPSTLGTEYVVNSDISVTGERGGGRTRGRGSLQSPARGTWANSDCRLPG